MSEYEPPAPETRVCRWCTEEKPFDMFVKNKDCTGGRSYMCKPCFS